MAECKAVLNIKGEHFQCDQDAPHDGWGHGNRAAQAIWLGADEYRREEGHVLLD